MFRYNCSQFKNQIVKRDVDAAHGINQIVKLDVDANYRQLTSIAPMTILLRTSTAVLSMIISILGRNYCHKAVSIFFSFFGCIMIIKINGCLLCS